MHGQGTSLRTYVLTRLALAIPTVFVLLTLVFLLMRVAPGRQDTGRRVFSAETSYRHVVGHAPYALIVDVSGPRGPGVISLAIPHFDPISGL
jgi:hypothetical protein